MLTENCESSLIASKGSGVPQFRVRFATSHIFRLCVYIRLCACALHLLLRKAGIKLSLELSSQRFLTNAWPKSLPLSGVLRKLVTMQIPMAAQLEPLRIKVCLCICNVFGHPRDNGSNDSVIHFFGSGTSSAIDFFRHGDDSIVDFFGWATYSSSAIDIATQADSVKTSMHVLQYCDALTNTALCNDDVNMTSLPCTLSDDAMILPSVGGHVHVDDSVRLEIHDRQRKQCYESYNKNANQCKTCVWELVRVLDKPNANGFLLKQSAFMGILNDTIARNLTSHGVKVEFVCILYGREVMITKIVVAYKDFVMGFNFVLPKADCYYGYGGRNPICWSMLPRRLLDVRTELHSSAALNMAAEGPPQIEDITNPHRKKTRDWPFLAASGYNAKLAGPRRSIHLCGSSLFRMALQVSPTQNRRGREYEQGMQWAQKAQSTAYQICSSNYPVKKPTHKSASGAPLQATQYLGQLLCMGSISLTVDLHRVEAIKMQLVLPLAAFRQHSAYGDCFVQVTWAMLASPVYLSDAKECLLHYRIVSLCDPSGWIEQSDVNDVWN
ncbi:hypothetical protein PR048_005074 [Dryococelus australis]|uniref:Uncharacterized protein n=1 Tax=Dryococelus australis TaxID=614101 RepID=A0ABQ9I885_9NEOP|nr:hypothetical protein PR048_005074 [Dryococelus australis]